MEARLDLDEDWYRLQFNMASKRNVKYIQPEVPSFLKKFKERVGYKEPASVNDKFADDVQVSESRKKEEEEEERPVEDEQPVIVVLKEGDMTAEEVEKHNEEHGSTDCWDCKSDKPIFKKPTKRPSSENNVKTGGKKQKSDVKVKPVKNKKLLSFDEEEDDEG